MQYSIATTPACLSLTNSLTSIDSVDVDPFSEELHLTTSRPTSPQHNTRQVDIDSDSDSDSDDELTKLELELKCPVCNDFYDLPMSSKCQHTFCAGCAKFDCNNKTTGLCCPICENSFTTFTQLCKNTLLEEIIKEYKTNRGLITNLYSLGKQAKKRLSRGEMKEPTIATKESESFMSISDCNSDFSSVVSPVEERTKSKRTLEKSSFNMNDNEQKRRRIDGNDNKSSTKLFKKPKIAYSVMNDKKLRSLLKEEGLLTHGSKNEMAARHSYYINLYNSNVDATNPKSKGELLRQVKKWEKAQQSDEVKKANLIKKSLNSPEGIKSYDILFHMIFIYKFEF
ncbi:hypothetical protein RclHR1_07910005 [Rhizophagus clarus]|uniref:Postreplication repair E3 ubiquitin-protein ligase RAD18 n=1 Tax=Rhizophagus clarus TaxID=94130 RepID=A0A2Z6RYX8_9GLOM|nr:hypothetical protein RclHR1_07910005 [Rhizophagus clarus]